MKSESRAIPCSRKHREPSTFIWPFESVKRDASPVYFHQAATALGCDAIRRVIPPPPPPPQLFTSQRPRAIQALTATPLNNARRRQSIGETAVLRALQDEGEYVMRLTIHKVERTDAGDYFCHAENAFGSATRPVSLRIRSAAAATNVTACCAEQNVAAACMDACSFYLDVEAVIDRPACIGDFDKLMKCAADGADHRGCCAKGGVPRRCLDWCRGEPLLNSKLCVLQHTKTILACFHEGRDRLPGPPLDVRVEHVDAHSVRLLWDPPAKNPAAAEMYRVLWRQRGARAWFKNDTRAASLRLTALKEGAAYECAVSAGNRLGTSALSALVLFTPGSRDKYITSAASVDAEGSPAGVAVGAGLAVVALVALAAAAVWYVRRRRLLGRKSSGGVAFENPSYLREMNMDHIQVPSGQPDGSVGGGAGGRAAARRRGAGAAAGAGRDGPGREPGPGLAGASPQRPVRARAVSSGRPRSPPRTLERCTCRTWRTWPRGGGTGEVTPSLHEEAEAGPRAARLQAAQVAPCAPPPPQSTRLPQAQPTHPSSPTSAAA
ncbi:Ig-like and fibronectin type-III domain-containing protein C25G4.10 [Gryllus bimaculatus]|nr:Ig-like and fibronectin type-III domain-containing protein C25G4.10 [Gryllus bimaculatus]